MDHKKRHFIEYILIIFLVTLFGILFYLFKSEREVLKYLSIVVSISYTLWGIIHSALERRLSSLVFFEYLLFGALVLLLLFTALSF